MAPVISGSIRKAIPQSSQGRRPTARYSGRSEKDKQILNDVMMKDVDQTEPRTPIPRKAKRLSNKDTKHSTVIVQEGHWVMVDHGNAIELEVMSTQDAVDAQYPKKLEGDKFNDPHHLERLRELRKQEENSKSFDQKILQCRRTKAYKNGRVTYLLKHCDESRELRCSSTDLKRLLKVNDLEEFYTKERMSEQNAEDDDTDRRFDSDDEIAVNNDEGGTPSPRRAAVRSLETPSPKYTRSTYKRKAAKPASTFDASDLTIVAKHTPGGTTKVTPYTSCIVRDPSGAHSFMIYKDVEGLADDKDWDYGHHPHPDMLALQHIKGHGGLSGAAHTVVDVIIRRQKTRHYITVFLEVLQTTDSRVVPKKVTFYDKLMKVRREYGYEYKGPIRCSASTFDKCGGRFDQIEHFLEKTDLGREYLAQRKAGRARTRSPTPQTEEEVATIKCDVKNIENKVSRLSKQLADLAIFIDAKYRL